MFLLYTKSSCPLCEKAKEIFQNRKISYTEYIIGQDITREEVLAKFPWATVAPIIIDEGKAILTIGILGPYLEENYAKRE